MGRDPRKYLPRVQSMLKTALIARHPSFQINHKSQEQISDPASHTSFISGLTALGKLKNGTLVVKWRTPENSTTNHYGHEES